MQFQKGYQDNIRKIANIFSDVGVKRWGEI